MATAVDSYPQTDICEQTDFCEQGDPRLLREVRTLTRFEDARRVHQSWLASGEKKLLLSMAERTPAWIGPDHLTVLGFIAQLLAGVCYAWSRWNRAALLLVIICLAVNWLGDSLDGTLARFRNQQRPRYGFYVDHMIDSFGSLSLMVGLALSGFMHPVIAITLLILFLLLSIQSYLATYTMGEFHISLWSFGPTELRVLLAVGNLALFWKPMVHVLGHGPYRLFDVGGAVGIAGMTLMIMAITIKNTRRLYHEERLK